MSPTKSAFDPVKAADMLPCTHTEVRQMRLRMGLNQAELAELLGVKEYTVWRWEHDGDKTSGSKDEGKNRIPLPASKLLRRLYVEKVGVPYLPQRDGKKA